MMQRIVAKRAAGQMVRQHKAGLALMAANTRSFAQLVNWETTQPAAEQGDMPRGKFRDLILISLTMCKYL